MRKRKGFLLLGLALAVTFSSLYVIYSSLDAQPRHEGLGSLLDSGQDVRVAELDGAGAQMVFDYLHNTPEWPMAKEFLEEKGLVLDPSQERAYQANVGGIMLSILRALAVTSPNGTMAEIIMVLDEQDVVSAWVMTTNLPPETAIGPDPKSKSIPVYVWSNGMPVFYVYFHHLIGGQWVPYHYLWHDSQDHPNWYYSYYNYWWWYYRWHNVGWPFWHDWFFSWYYGERFCYWSTWFPIGEGGLLASALAMAIPCLIWARRIRQP